MEVKLKEVNRGMVVVLGGQSHIVQEIFRDSYGVIMLEVQTIPRLNGEMIVGNKEDCIEVVEVN